MGAVTPDQAEMACNLETTLFGSSGPGRRAQCQRQMMNQGSLDPACVLRDLIIP